ncbi:MAG TPA: CoA ester lyase [Candidatus Thermoplasmatota archaeon]|nr:CoA ester lyase [Candidatus Thermoplasmatota archaeon]
MSANPAAERIRRSVLFVPGDRPDRIPKALASGADTVVLDLEDAVGPGEKAKARRDVADALASPAPAGSKVERVVRVNPPGTDVQAADLAALLGLHLDAVMVPKVERAEDIRRVAAATPHDVAILPIVESARGVLNALEIAESARVGAIVFGAEDFAATTGVRRTKGNLEVLYARSRVVLAAAAAGVGAIDQVYVTIDDPAGLAAEAAEGRTLGFTGKMAIHPKQLPPIHEAFTPTKAEADAAAALLAEAEKHGFGVFNYGGRMIDRPLMEQARRAMRLARHAGVL